LMQVDRKGTPSTQLGPRMGMEATSLSRTLNGMEAMGLVERRPDADDGRRALVFLTEDGVAARRQARDLVKAVNARIRELLGDHEVDALILNLRKLNELFDRPEQLLGGNTSQPPLAS
jgi:MarR family transcriptional regulator, organic hydroperoxide resistance regulator